jgi:DNA polymerase III epsilon subunit-like protein
MKTFLVFDTETTGLPADYNAPMGRLDNWPRVIQLSFIHFDEFGNDIMSYNALVKPDGWEMPVGKFWIDNGFSQAKSMREGLPIDIVIDEFIERINNSDVLVAHNIKFDYNIIGAEMIRLGKKANKRLPQVCTMLQSVDFCKIPGKMGFKWPKLPELHSKLFGRGFSGAHDAMCDTMATKSCFIELCKREIIPGFTSFNQHMNNI